MTILFVSWAPNFGSYLFFLHPFQTYFASKNPLMNLSLDFINREISRLAASFFSSDDKNHHDLKYFYENL